MPLVRAPSVLDTHLPASDPVGNVPIQMAVEYVRRAPNSIARPAWSRSTNAMSEDGISQDPGDETRRGGGPPGQRASGTSRRAFAAYGLAVALCVLLLTWVLQ